MYGLSPPDNEIICISEPEGVAGSETNTAASFPAFAIPSKVREC